MKPLLSALVLCLSQFLDLTDDQASSISQNNSDYNIFSVQQQQQIQHDQAQITVETAKDPIDSVALGTLYAAIITTCRGLVLKAAESQQLSMSVLADVQKMKLNLLNVAMKLAPTVSGAQFGNLLRSYVSPPAAFNTARIFSATSYDDPFFYSGVSGVPGCASPFPADKTPINQSSPFVPTGILQSGTAGAAGVVAQNR